MPRLRRRSACGGSRAWSRPPPRSWTPFRGRTSALQTRALRSPRVTAASGHVRRPPWASSLHRVQHDSSHTNAILQFISADRALLEETEFLQARVTPTARPAPGTARAAPQFDIPDDGDLLAAVAAQESLARRSAAAQASSSGASPAPHAGVPGVPLLQSIASIGPRTAVSSELRSKHSIFPQLHSGVSTASQALPSPAGDDPWASQARYPTLAGPARAKVRPQRVTQSDRCAPKPSRPGMAGAAGDVCTDVCSIPIPPRVHHAGGERALSRAF